MFRKLEKNWEKKSEMALTFTFMKQLFPTIFVIFCSPPPVSTSLIRGFLDTCGLAAGLPGREYLFDRGIRESCTLRQFLERRGALVRLYLDLPFLVTSPEPLSAFATQEEVVQYLIFLNPFPGG